jgi:hypothetical protein
MNNDRLECGKILLTTKGNHTKEEQYIGDIVEEKIIELLFVQFEVKC